VDFEKSLAAIEVAPEIEQDPTLNSNAVTLNVLQTKLPSIDLSVFLNTTADITLIEAVPSYLSALDSILQGVQVEIIDVYLCWRAILAFKGALPLEIADT
jgi:predicted metalloendopeptidase